MISSCASKATHYIIYNSFVWAWKQSRSLLLHAWPGARQHGTCIHMAIPLVGIACAAMRCMMQHNLVIVGPRHVAFAEQLTLLQLRWPHQEVLAGNVVSDGYARDCIWHRPMFPTPNSARGVRVQLAAESSIDVVLADALNLTLQKIWQVVSNNRQQQISA